MPKQVLVFLCVAACGGGEIVGAGPRSSDGGDRPVPDARGTADGHFAPGDGSAGTTDGAQMATDGRAGGNDAMSEACAGGPLAAPIPGCAPPAPPTTGDPHQDCVNRINQLRAECQCLPPLARWNEAEACVAKDAEYDVDHGPHAGFGDGICTPQGFAQNECPGWPSIEQTITGCLQQMWDEGPGEPYSEHGHYINMTNPDYSQVACGFFTTSGGEVWAVQNFR